MDSSPIMVFGGSGSPGLTQRICEYLRVPRGLADTLRFSDGNIFVRIGENVRGQDVYLVQSTGFPPNDNFMELLFWVDAFKRASAASVTVILPYFSYAKGDKKDEPRVSIRARVCADAIEAAGADRIVTMDLHAPQIQGFFRKPVDNLYALPLLAGRLRELEIPSCVVVSPDVGFAKQARRFAAVLSASIAIADKGREGHDEQASVFEIIGDVAGRAAVIVDDFSVSGGTLAEVAAAVLARGATEVYAAITHGMLTPAALERIDRSPIRRLFMTDTVEGHLAALPAKVEVVSVCSLFGEAIKRIHRRESISQMFAPGEAR